MSHITTNPKDLLNKAKKILLIDWPNADVPKILLNEGFEVVCYSPSRYTRAKIENGHVIFEELDGLPGPVDIVNIYRPEQEHPDIIVNHVLPLSAKILWLHPPITSSKTRALAFEHGLTFIEGISITEVK